MATKIEFGTDGWRAIIAEDFTFENVRYCAQAEVVAANDVTVYLCNRPEPTPVVSYAVLDRKAGGGVVITSSHNPAPYNGFKYKSEYAGSAA